MLRQNEGSAGGRRGRRACRPEVVCAYPISPQTHIVEGLSDLVRAGKLDPCEYVMVESEFAAMSVCIGASAAGARSYTATASQGLLYMAEALYNASGLGLPIVMTVANRAIGSPINIWNDHSDTMSQRDSGWIQLYAEDNQEAVDLHIQAFKLAERLSLPVMVCMDGFILTHAYERIDAPSQEQVDAYLPAFEPRQVLDPADPVTIGAMVGPGGLHRGQVPGPRQADAGAGRDPRGGRGVQGGVRARVRAACCAATAPRTPRRSSSRSARSWGRSRRRSTRCARRASRSAPWRSNRSVPSRWRRSARRSRGPSGSSCSRRRWPSASAGSSPPTCGWRSPASSCTATPWSPASAAARSPRSPCTASSPMPSPTASTRSASSTWTGTGSKRSCGDAGRGPNRPARREHPARSRRRRREVALTMRARDPKKTKTPPGNQPVKFYQAGSFVVGNRLLDPEQRSVQARMERSNTLTSGHRACQGCGEALGARYALDAAMRATDGQLIAANATGCLEVFSTPFPESSWQLPWIHSLFGNAPAVATGVAAAMKAKGREDVRVVGQGGDGGTLDIGFACLSGMFERNDDVLFICYDNEAYMNTGVQRSGATPPGGAHRQHQADRRPPGQRVRPGQGRAADRDGARHPLRGDGDGRRVARPRVQGRAGDVVPRRPLPAHLRPLPARLGSAVARHREDRPPGQGDRPLPRLRGRGRRGDRRLEDPPPGPGRGVPEAAAPLRPPLRRAPSPRRDRAIQEIADRNIRRYGLLAPRGGA